MPPESKQWKQLQQVEGRGGYMYLGKTELRELAEEGAINLDEPIEYSVSVGVSDGRARAFIGIRNASEDGESE